MRGVILITSMLLLCSSARIAQADLISNAPIDQANLILHLGSIDASSPGDVLIPLSLQVTNSAIPITQFFINLEIGGSAATAPVFNAFRETDTTGTGLGLGAFIFGTNAPRSLAVDSIRNGSQMQIVTQLNLYTSYADVPIIAPGTYSLGNLSIDTRSAAPGDYFLTLDDLDPTRIDARSGGFLDSQLFTSGEAAGIAFGQPGSITQLAPFTSQGFGQAIIVVPEPGFASTIALFALALLVRRRP